MKINSSRHFSLIYTEFSVGQVYTTWSPHAIIKCRKNGAKKQGGGGVGVGCGLVATHHAAVRLQNSLQIVVVLLVAELPLVRAVAVPPGPPAVPIFPPAVPAISGIGLLPGEKKVQLILTWGPLLEANLVPRLFYPRKSRVPSSSYCKAKSKREKGGLQQSEDARGMYSFSAKRLVSHYLLVNLFFSTKTIQRN